MSGDRSVSPAMRAMRATRGGPWRPPTRRAFLTMLGLGTAVLGLRGVMRGSGGGASDADDPPRKPWTGTTRWIGHC